MKTLVTTLGAVASLCGCASSLHIYDAGNRQAPGVPFRTHETYVKTGTHDKASDGGNCEPAQFVTSATLATGALYYAKVVPAQFAKTEFHVKYGDSGAISEISLGTEPSAEALTAAREFVQTVIPLGPAAGASPAAARAPAKACDAGERDVKFIRLDDFIQGSR